MNEKCLNYNEKTRQFLLEDSPRRADGWSMVSYSDERAAVAFTDFIRYQFPIRERIIPSADDVSRMIGNLERFATFWKEYVTLRQFEIEGPDGRPMQPAEII